MNQLKIFNCLKRLFLEGENETYILEQADLPEDANCFGNHVIFLATGFMRIYGSGEY